MQHDDDLNNLMNAHAVPKARKGLAEDIIHTALSHVREKRTGFWSELMAMLALPHPSVALATCILLGLAVGMQASDGVEALQQDWSSFLVINEGGWL